MVEPNKGSGTPQDIPGRVFPIIRRNRIRAAQNPRFQFHDAVLTVVVFSIWGYRLLSRKNETHADLKTQL